MDESNDAVKRKTRNVKRGSESGQSLIELMIAIGIAGIFITGATFSVDVALRLTSQNKQAQPASFLAQELMDAVVVAARANWQGNIAAPFTTGGSYFISGGSSIAGTESKILNNLTYTRSFIITDPATDASKKLITVTVTWPVGASVGTVTLQRYVTRNQNVVFRQTDWSGGPTGLSTATFGDQTKFYQGTNMDSTTGGILFISGLLHP